MYLQKLKTLPIAHLVNKNALPFFCLLIACLCNTAYSEPAKSTQEKEAPEKNRVTEAAEILGIGDAAGTLSTSTGSVTEKQSTSKSEAMSSLEKLVQIAAAENRNIAIEESKLAESAAAKKSAWGKFQPGVNLFAGQSRNDTKSITNSSTSGSDQKDYGVRLRLNVFNGMADIAAVQSANRGFEAAEFSTEATRQQVALSARKAIIEYNQSAMELLLAKAASASAAEIRSMSLRKLKAGLVGKIDLHKTEVRESETAAQVVQAELSMQRAKLNMLRACGIDFDSAAKISSLTASLEASSLPIPSIDAIRERLDSPQPKETFTELVADRLRQRSDLETSASYRKRWIPSVDLTASISRDQSEPRGIAETVNDKTQKSQNQNIGLELNWKLWAPSDDSSIAQSIAARDRAMLQSADAKDRAKTYRANLGHRIRGLSETLSILRVTWEKASKLYDAQADLYQAGAVDIFEVINSENQRLSALKSWYQYRSELHLAALQWDALELGLVPDQNL